MIDFMVLAGPRSGTTWAANWLTTDSTFCLHDPLLEYTLRGLDQLTIPGRRVGLSCTALAMYPEWVLPHPAKKVILYRDIDDINNSLTRLGLATIERIKHIARLDALKNIPVFKYEHLFDSSMAKIMATHLGVPFDAYRHDLLIQMNVQPQWRTLHVGKEASAALIKRIQEAR